MAPLQPGVAVAAQVARGAGVAGQAPALAGLGPPVVLGVTAGLDEGQKLGPTHRLGVDSGSAQPDLMGAQFVVEGETGVGFTAQPPGPGVEHQRRRRRRQRAGLPAAIGHRHAQALRRVERRLVVHVLVQQHQAEEIQRLVGLLSPLLHARQQNQRVVQLGPQIVAGGLDIGQGQGPAAVVRHPAGVVERIGIGAAIRSPRQIGVGAPTLLPGRKPRQPPGLEPADVAQFPQRRVELGVQRHLQAGQRLLEDAEQGQGVVASADQCGGQGLCG